MLKNLNLDQTAAGMSAVIFFGLLALIVLLILALRLCLKKTIYMYKNIVITGTVIFLTVLAAALGADILAAGGFRQVSFGELLQFILSFPREFSFWGALFIVGISVLVGISNIVLIRHEGFCLNNALSLIVAGLYIGGTAAVYFIADLLPTNLFFPLFLLTLLCYLECTFVGAVIMGWKAAHQVPSYDKDFIIILGCSIDKRGGLLPLLKGRVNRAVRFAWEQEIASGKPLKYVPSGGQGPNEVISEGSAMELYLLTHGAEDYEVFPEKKSRNTWENMVFSKKLIDQLQPGAKIAFATTNYHMLRSGILARKAGIDAEGIAGDTKWYFWPNGFVREFFGILRMHIKAHLMVAAIAAALCGAFVWLVNML